MRKLFWILSILGTAICVPAATVVMRSGPTPIVRYVPTATSFTTNDYILHTGDLTGIADSKVFTLSLWFKLNSANNGALRLIAGFCSNGGSGGQRVRVTVTSANKISIVGIGSDGITKLQVDSTSISYTNSATWHHVALSVDMSDSAKRAFYVDGVDEANWTVYIDAALDFANGGDLSEMSAQGGTFPTAGSMSELWFTTTYLSFVSGANLTLFRDSAGHPVSLGPTGLLPTGVQPILYLANPFGTFQNNLGSGGNFTVGGSLANDTSIP